MGGSVKGILTAYDSANTPIPGVTVYLSFSGDGQAGDFADSYCGNLTATPQTCPTGSPGQQGGSLEHNVPISYCASAPNVPNGGTDTLTAAIDAAGTGAVTDP